MDVSSWLLHRPPGLLVTGLDHSDAARALIQSSGLPCVHLMETSATAGVYSVGFSQADAAAALTRHLLGRGYRRIAFGAAQLDARTLQRLVGWRREMQCRRSACADAGVAEPGPSSLSLGRTMFEQVVAQTPPVDAIFICNDDPVRPWTFRRRCA
ncbi:hypothetical protein J7E62_19850 [Variovorax paradoxus]|nr:hypothetical protein [Variovorax paradoxus]